MVKGSADLSRMGVPDTTRRDCAFFAGFAGGVYSLNGGVGTSHLARPGMNF
jgi:hypothetical protein